MTPVTPPMVNRTRKASAKHIAVVKRIAPPHIVASQLKIFTPGRHGDQHAGRRKTMSARQPMPDGEHVVGPDGEAEEAMATVRPATKP